VRPDAGRLAVVDLGSNSVRLFLCEGLVDGAPAGERTTIVTGLRRGAAADDSIAPEALARLDDCLVAYARRRDAFGAARTVVAGTSAVRDAPDRSRIEAIVRERMGVPLTVLSGDEEAACAFAGARLGVDGDADILVVDIGGGSTELVRGGSSGPSGIGSLQLGAVRQTERHLHSDPATGDELKALRSDIRAIVEASVPADVRVDVSDGVAVAGTPTSAAAIEMRLDPYDSSRVHGHRLSLASCERIERMLAELPEAKRREVTGLHPERSPTIVAGMVILVEAMRAFALESIQVGEHDILYGAALEAAL
jgi:exopolyphosphatase / guanosine-5'-triphosphate,3'-diphosphate pyrophosphatase